MRTFNKDRNCALCTHQHHLFQFLTEEELMMINESRIEIRYKPNETIIKESSPATHFITFNKGLIKMCLEEKNKTLIIQYLKPPDFFLGPGVFTDRRNHYTLVAIEETFACLIDINIFLKILPSNKEFMYEFLKYQCEKELLISERLVTLTQKQMHGRIASALMYLNNEIFKAEGASVKISKTDLANFSNMNKDSVGRVLKEFQEGGIINMESDTIALIDLNILKQIGEYG